MTSHPSLMTDLSPETIAEIESAVPRCQWVGITDCVFPARFLIIYRCPECKTLGCVYVCLLHKGLIMLGRGRLACGACEAAIPRGEPVKAEKL